MFALASYIINQICARLHSIDDPVLIIPITIIVAIFNFDVRGKILKEIKPNSVNSTVFDFQIVMIKKHILRLNSETSSFFGSRFNKVKSMKIISILYLQSKARLQNTSDATWIWTCRLNHFIFISEKQPVYRRPVKLRKAEAHIEPLIK